MHARPLHLTKAFVAVGVVSGCSLSGTVDSAPDSSARAVSTGSASSSGAEASAFGEATLTGTIAFSGKAPEMKVPKLRGDADVCKATRTRHNAVLVKDGKLKDVLVRIAAGTVPGRWRAPEKAAELHQIDCMYLPRIQGVMTGQLLMIYNDDPTLHNLLASANRETLFGRAQPKGSPPFDRVPDEPAIWRFACDLHPWMRAFVVVTDHPFFAVSGEDGRFRIERVPAGKHTIETWHSQYGRLEKRGVEVGAAGEVIADFEYDDTMSEPADNKGELVGQW